MKQERTAEHKRIGTLMFRRVLALTSAAILTLFVTIIILTAIFSQFAIFNLNDLISNGTFYLIIGLAFVITLMISLLISATFSKPLADISNAAQEVAKGNLNIYVERKNKKQTGKPNDIQIVYDSFNKMVQELKHSEIFKSDFISNVSHEIKTPLSTIQGYATLLQDEKLPKETKEEYIKIIVAATNQLSTLTTNILKLSKLENQAIFATPKEYNVAEQIRETLLVLQSAWQEKDIELNIDLDEINLKLDKELMFQVWKNLLENAIKFTNNKGKIEISLKEENNQIVAKISDNGIGMSKTTKEHLFDKFFQGDNSHSNEGNGLGLSLVKKILDIHQAKIEVESQLNIGSTFTITLKK